MFDSFPSRGARALPLQQHPNFVAALRACGQDPLQLHRPVPAVILRQRLGGRVPVAMLARAEPSLMCADCDDWLHSNGLARTPLILSPDSPCATRLAARGAVPLMTPNWVAEIDLTATSDERRARLHPKWRNRLVRAESNKHLRISISTRALTPDHWLFTADLALQRQRGFRNWPTALTLAYARKNPDQAVLITARDGRKDVAAMLFLRHGRAATYHIGHSTPAGRALSAHTLILWRAACWLAEHGVARLDLGQIDTRNAAGLARFKLGSGAVARPLGGTWLWWPPLGRSARWFATLDRHRMQAGSP
ncbi:GNAT family N-acetyltransferase [Sedimentitalea sp. XS_ASV28]|uniref:GNAT family N-acetyltransferase n=1 Tax=Sedimentitalea sp. XS_ASV28 TaxID=3241296 RepID=UPI003512634C